MKRYDIIALLLVIYLAVMAYFGRGMLLSGNYWEYFSIIGVTLLVIFILRWAMKRREKIREENEGKSKTPLNEEPYETTIYHKP